MTHKDRALAVFSGKSVDRYPLWYGASPEFTRKLVAYAGAKNEDEALYDLIGIDFKTIRPKYVGPPLKTYDNGDVDTDWGGAAVGFIMVNRSLTRLRALMR